MVLKYTMGENDNNRKIIERIKNGKKRELPMQDRFISDLVKNNKSVNIKLINNDNVIGQIKSFDNFSILLSIDKKEVLVYKHAIVYISPNG